MNLNHMMGIVVFAYLAVEALAAISAHVATSRKHVSLVEANNLERDSFYRYCRFVSAPMRWVGL